MLGGVFATDDVPGPGNAGVVVLSGAGFQGAPAVMMDISGLDFECGRNLELPMSNSALQRQTMT